MAKPAIALMGTTKIPLEIASDVVVKGQTLGTSSPRNGEQPLGRSQINTHYHADPASRSDLGNFSDDDLDIPIKADTEAGLHACRSGASRGQALASLMGFLTDSADSMISWICHDHRPTDESADAQTLLPLSLAQDASTDKGDEPDQMADGSFT
ncbi:predicted protein [Histoplasma capsulatum H143]|uniref:Uncharacterized protein n=1 Tax=Ajellomyces capsulatus (strain H143) TaxID=544712 RepID=C6H7Y3_AJECH|nr:predicted protein [Histoplasma capsulatum H143]